MIHFLHPIKGGRDAESIDTTHFHIFNISLIFCFRGELIRALSDAYTWSIRRGSGSEAKLTLGAHCNEALHGVFSERGEWGQKAQGAGSKASRRPGSREQMKVIWGARSREFDPILPFF